MRFAEVGAGVGGVVHGNVGLGTYHYPGYHALESVLLQTTTTNVTNGMENVDDSSSSGGACGGGDAAISPYHQRHQQTACECEVLMLVGLPASGKTRWWVEKMSGGENGNSDGDESHGDSNSDGRNKDKDEEEEAASKFRAKNYCLLSTNHIIDQLQLNGTGTFSLRLEKYKRYNDRWKALGSHS